MTWQSKSIRDTTRCLSLVASMAPPGEHAWASDGTVSNVLYESYNRSREEI
jgi:hypothetical protein